MKDEDVHLNLLSRYVSNEISLEEIEELLQWINEDPEREEILRDFQETWEIAKNYPENFKVDATAAWVRLRNTMTEPEPPKKINTRLIKKWIAAMAIFAMFMIGLIWGFKHLYI